MNIEFYVKKIMWCSDSPLSTVHFTLTKYWHRQEPQWYFMNYPCIHKMFTIDLTPRTME